jgi:hypothetical protein
MPRFRLIPCIIAASLAVTSGCSTDSTLRVKSVAGPVQDVPNLPISAYWASDPNTADLYLTDLDSSQLDRGTDLSKVSGRILHIHMFIAPLAGSTPIASSACSVTVRHVVLAQGALGVYSGGGFMLPSGHPGDATFGGTISDATLRLTGKTVTFNDRLGPATLSASIATRHDESLAKRIGARMSDVLAAVTPIDQGSRTARADTGPAGAGH